ncbi:glycosyltransferase family 4 protein [Anabaena sp. UHCC 0204]|uniref:glycosyltransferase family 4 protein n=1 Tax=Anabaena sp. UHCC 0204 TaxID=2590009 RepID=UPI00352EAF75
MHIVLLFTNFGPYHIARASKLSEHLALKEWKMTAIELARFEQEYKWETEVSALNFDLVSLTKNKLENQAGHNLVWQLYQRLFELKPDVLVIAGYSRPSMLAALLWGLWHGKYLIIMSATTEGDAPRIWWREMFKSWFLKKYDAALVGGQPHKRYFMKLGMVPESIFLGYNVVENSVFNTQQIHLLPNPLIKPFFLTVNRFVPKKNLSRLISAYAAYRELAGSDAWDLVLAGDGILLSSLKKQINNLNLPTSVHLPGFLQQNQLLPYFAHAGCFIHASIQEQWGLVVNEAMAAGLPVLVSNRCGCYEDLIIEGVNGFGFDPEDSQQLTELMLKMSSGEIDLQSMGNAALEHIGKFSPDYFAQGLIQSISYALNKH